MSVAFVSGSGSLKAERCPMDFDPVWGKGKIFSWYHTLPSKAIRRLQVHITRGAVPHRFIVAHMQDKSICRFDRRPLNASVSMLVYETAVEPNRKAADEASVVNPGEWAEIQLTCRQEINLNLPEGTDILLVLSACYAMAQDDKAHMYALREYNCYFFAWTIVMIVMRHTLPFSIPSPEAVEARLINKIDQFTTALTNRIIDALLKIVLDTITAFRTHTGSELHPGLSKRELAVWGLPTPAVRGLLRNCLRLRLHFGLKEKLLARVRAQLEKNTSSVLTKVLHSQAGVSEQVRNRLWLYELNTIFHSPISEQILEILWDSLLEALAEGYGDIKQDGSNSDLSKLPMLHRLKYRFFGRNVIQFSQVWNEALNAALPAAKKAGRGQYPLNKSHEGMFKIAFDAACADALQAAKAVIERTGPELNDSKRDTMWRAVWRVWKDVWDSSLARAQPMVLDLINSAMEDLVGWVAQDVVEELGNSEIQTVQATIQFQKKRQEKALTMDSLQQIVRNFIQSVPGQTHDHRKNIEEAMARAWDISQVKYKLEPLQESSSASLHMLKAQM